MADVDAILGHETPAGTTVYFGGKCRVSRFIGRVTYSRISHVGGIVEVTRRDLENFIGAPWWHPGMPAIIEQWPAVKPLLFESTSLNDAPCLLQRKNIHGVQCHEVLPAIAAYDGDVWLSRPATPFTEPEKRHLAWTALSYLGTPYDKRGAFVSGLRWTINYLCGITRDRSSLYCAEYWGECVLQSGHLGEFGFDAGKFTPAGFRDLMETAGFSGGLVQIKRGGQ